MDFKQYKGKNILAWLWFDPDYYNPDKGNTVCYVYPRVLVNKFHYELIDPADFPKHGSIRVNINGGDTAEDLYERFGSFVSLKINEDDPYPNYDGNNMYSLRYNSSFGRTNSGIWIEKFSGKDFYQIIDVDSDISTLINTRSIPEPDCTIRTTLVLLRLNSKLYGPFEYDTTEGTMKLRGIKDYQYNIGEYSAVDYNDELLVITDQNDNEAVIIMPKSVLVSPEKSENRFDWISEETLIDSFIESMRVENSYTRDQIRQLKEMAHQLIERGSNVSFTKERISKIQSLMVGISQNEEYAQTMLQFALSDESTKEALVSNGEVTATLYYQPVISAVQFENDLTLFRTTKPPAGNPDYYTPDFVLKFASSEDDEEYAIFDAKFSSRANIKKHSLPEVIRKYSCEISAASRSSAPKMVWVLQGRVNGSENAIWKYHNSQLASTYRPITSFGIVSINTAVEIRQRLWNEIRSSISLLQ